MNVLWVILGIIGGILIGIGLTIGYFCKAFKEMNW